MEIKLILIMLILIMATLIAYDLWTRTKTMTKEEKIDMAKGIALGLVVLAEEKFGAKTGPIKYSWVVMELYKALPAFVVKYVTPDIIDDAIEWSVEKMKTILGE